MTDPEVKRLWLPRLVFALCLGIGLCLVSFAHSARVAEQRVVQQQLLSGIGSEIGRRLSYTLTSTYLLAQEVIRTRGRFRDFDDFAHSTLQQLEGVTNLQLAPGGIITDIHPLAGNEAAIGHDILVDDRRRAEARLAIATRSLTLAGPFELVQGGTAVIARNPVFLPPASPADGDEESFEESFWGFTSALIMLDDLLDSVGLESLADRDYRFRLSRPDPLTQIEEKFAGTDEPADGSWQSIDISVPNGVWKLSIGSARARNALPDTIGLALCLLLALCLAGYCRRVIDEPAQLRRRVAEQTRDLQTLAYHDSLTGLANRNRFFDSLTAALETARRGERSLAVMLLDLDHFKDVNDTLGHDVGDTLLVEASRRMLARMPSTATLSRLGGDEFTIVVQGEDPVATAERLSAEIIAVLDMPFRLHGHTVNVSASIGIAALGDGVTSANDLLKCADQAMYIVKNDGRGSFHVFTQDMQSDIADKVQLVADLRQALRNDEFELLYQPIVCAGTGRVERAEALLRWNHPAHGVVMPSAFIPLAETNGLIDLIGDWVFARAAQQAWHWRRACLDSFQVSVNVSSVQFRIDDPVPHWVALVTSLGLEPAAMVVEVTESVLSGGEHGEHGVKRLETLRSAGFEVALDDYGVGRSSLFHLRNPGFDYLKIDVSCIAGLSAGSEDHALCRALIALARRSGLKVVAEGVETESQRALLQAECCDFLQGYLYAPPLDAAAFERAYLVSDSERAA